MPPVAVEEDAPASSVVAESATVPGDEGAPVGPSEGEESAFLAEQREQGFTAPARAVPPVAREPDDASPLPPLEDLVARIPSETRQLMEELFRAKFVTVKRVPRAALKN